MIRKRDKIVDSLQEFFNLKSSDPITFAREIRIRTEELRIAFFEVAINYIREIAEMDPNDCYSPVMKEYHRQAQEIVE